MNECMNFQLARPVAGLREQPSYSIVLSDTKPTDVRAFVERLLTTLLKEKKLNVINLDQEFMDRLVPFAANKSFKGVTRFTRAGFRKLQSYTFKSLYKMATPQSEDEKLRLLRNAVESESEVTFIYGDQRQRVNTVLPVKLHKQHFLGFHAGGFRSFSYQKVTAIKLSETPGADDWGNFSEPEITITFKGQDSGHVQLGAYRRKQDNPTRLTTFNRATLKAKLIWSPHSSIDRLI